MNARARATMSRNAGLMTTAEAKDAGLTLGHIRSAVRAGELVSIRRGVYADATVWG